ncbi:MAG: M48 family metallopeptidase [Bacteroidota bacterium]
MRTPTLLLILLLSATYTLAQPSARFGRTYSDTLPDNFKLSTTSLREHIYNGIPDKIKNELYQRSAYRFADQSAVQLSSTFSSGRVYSDWPALEDYINRVLAQVMPKELAQDTVIHAYIMKDGNFNASMTAFGILFVNVGLLDEVPSEGALAGVLTHELAHYYLKHALNRYVRAERGEFQRVFMKTDASRFSVQNELQADSLGIVWMERSGYGIKGIDESMKAIQRLEKKSLMQKEKTWELTETTHPLSDKRLAQIADYSKSKNGATGEDYMVSKASFLRFKEVAKSEILKLLLYDYQYDECIEKAFKFHILNPNKAEYVYYLMEGIRRKCYFNSDLWKHKFVTDIYYKENISANIRTKEKVQDHIFKSIPKDYLCLTDDDINNIQARFYWEGVEKFTTYEEAFNFFAQVGELFNEPECVLSNALSLNFDPDARNKLLAKYLSYEKIQFRDFATRLVKGTLKSGLPEKTLTTLSDFYATVKQGSEEIYIRNEKLVQANDLTPIFDTAVAGFARRRFLNLSELQNNNVNDFVLFQDLKELALRRLVAKGERTEVHILDPRFWEIMYRYKVDEVEFIDFSYYDVRKAEYELESYKKVIGTSIIDLISELKRNRYLDTRIACVREIPESVMKSVHFGWEQKLSYNKPGRAQVIDYVVDNLKAKDDEIVKMDKEYSMSKK